MVPTVLMGDVNIRPMDGLVYGVVYWFTKLKNERCTASNKTISDIIGCSDSAVTHGLVRLNKAGYIQIRLDKDNHREEIIPLIAFSKIEDPSTIEQGGGTSVQGGVAQVSKEGGTSVQQNKNIENRIKEEDNSPTPLEVLGIPKTSTAPITANSAGNDYGVEWKDFLEHYKKESGAVRTTPTDGRVDKFKTRRKTFSLEDMKKAVTNCFQDSWFSGQNDRGWRADIDYILRNDEKLEKLLYLKPRSGGGKIFGAV